MDKGKRIAELEERKRQIDIEIAFCNGRPVEYSERVTDNYEVIEEPKRIPFDGSDAFNLTLQKFRHIADTENETLVCTKANNELVMLADFEVKYETLAKYWLKWNDLTKEWQPCNKVA